MVEEIGTSRESLANQVKETEEKVQFLKERKAVYDVKFDQADAILEELRTEIRANIFNENATDGILTSDLENYFKCIQLNKSDLHRLLAHDDKYWSAAVTKIKEEAEIAESKCCDGLAKCRDVLDKVTDSNKKGAKASDTSIKGVRAKLVHYSKSFSDGFHDILDELPEYEIECAQEKCRLTDKLVYELHTLVKQADDALDELRDALTQNFFSEENKKGLLVQEPTEFFNCISFDQEKLIQLLTREKTHCQEKLESVEDQIEVARQELMEMIESQQTALQNYLEKIQDIKPKPKPKYEMRQIGLIGPAHDHDLFSWPDQETLDKMPTNVHVTKMVFKSKDPQQVNHVQFFFSDGTQSPVFETETGEKLNEQTLELDELNRPVKKSKGNKETTNFVNWLVFEDATGAEIAKYDPASSKTAESEIIEYTISEQEQLIGFYGYRSLTVEGFERLGLIVRYLKTEQE